MTGNVNEWVRDWYQTYYYEKSPELNPQGPEYDKLFATRKVSRGFGRANSDFRDSILFERLARDPDVGGGEGFRCAINSDQPLPKLSELPVMKQ